MTILDSFFPGFFAGVELRRGRIHAMLVPQEEEAYYGEFDEGGYPVRERRRDPSGGRSGQNASFYSLVPKRNLLQNAVI